MHKPIAFLDRDGTIIEDKEYAHKIEDLEFIEGSIEALQMLQERFEIIIVTNQSGIGRGYFSLEEFHRFHDHLLKQLGEEGITIRKTLFCPHKPDEGCECRKPNTGKVRKYLKKEGLTLDPDASFMAGDKTEDLKLAENLKIKGILVRTGKGGTDKKYDTKPYYVAEDLLDAVKNVIK